MTDLRPLPPARPALPRQPAQPGPTPGPAPARPAVPVQARADANRAELALLSAIAALKSRTIAPRKRVTQPDLTGFYELVPEKGKVSAVSLQLVQAGRVIVGWFAAPPNWVGADELASTRTRGARFNDTRMPSGVLVVNLPTDPLPSRGVKFDWCAMSPASGPDPMDKYPIDPPDVFSGGKTNPGFLRLLSDTFPEIGLEVGVCFDYQADFPIDDTSRYDRFRRISGACRLANDSIRDLGRELQERLIVENVTIPPESLIELRKAKIAPMMDERPPVAQKIEDWFTSAAGSRERKNGRDALISHLRDAFTPDMNGDRVNIDPYRAYVYSRMRQQAAWKNLTIGGATRNYLQWYRLAAAEELDTVRANQAANPKKYQSVDSNHTAGVLRRCGIEFGGVYQYSFVFTPIVGDLTDKIFARLGAIATPKITLIAGVGAEPGQQSERDVVKAIRGTPASSSAAGALDLTQVLKLKAQIFRLDIKKVRLVVDAKGEPVLKDGVAQVDPSYAFGWDTGFRPGGLVVDTAKLLSDGFVGIMGEVGAGITFNDATFKSGKLAVTGALPSTNINSSLDLVKEDFAFATLHGVLVGGPNVKIGAWANMTSFSSRFFEVMLRAGAGGFVLSTIDTESLKLAGPSLKDLSPKFSKNLDEMQQDYAKKWTQPQIEARVLELTGGWAATVPLFDPFEKKVRFTDPEPPPRPAERKFHYTGGSVDAFFQRDSSNLDEAPSGTTALAKAMGEAGAHSRDILEVLLATYRSLFTSPSANLAVLGFASPEQRADYNQILSSLRARAVVQAIRDAFGSAMKIPDAQIKADGVGERLALKCGLKDPEAAGMTGAQFAIKYPDQAVQWPSYRRVDVFVDDKILAAVKAGP